MNPESRELLSNQFPRMIPGMRITVPILALAAGIVFGWLMRGAPNGSRSQAVLNSYDNSAALTPSVAAKSGEHPFPLRDTFLSPDQSKEEIQKMVRGISRDPNERRRLRDFLLLLDGLTKENAPLLREALTALPYDAGIGQCQRLFFQRWGEIAGEDAARIALQPVPGQTPERGAVANVILGWMQNDLEGALRFSEQLPNGSRDRALATRTMGLALIAIDPDRAADFILRQPFEDWNNETAFTALVEEAESKGRNDLITKWYEMAPGGERKGALAVKVAEALHSESIDRAVEFLNNIGDTDWRDWDMYWPIAGDYAKRDPKAALDWIFSLPKFTDEPAPPGLAAVLEQWHAKDPASATQWLMQNTEQPWWPRAARGVIDSFNHGNRQSEMQGFLIQLTPETLKMIKEDGMRPKPKMTKAN